MNLVYLYLHAYILENILQTWLAAIKNYWIENTANAAIVCSTVFASIALIAFLIYKCYNIKQKQETNCGKYDDNKEIENLTKTDSSPKYPEKYDHDNGFHFSAIQMTPINENIQRVTEDQGQTTKF